MGQSYPDTQGYAFSFSRGEITLRKKIYTAITNISIDQPTEEGVIQGTSPEPLARTEGQMGLGEGTITFSDERERLDFIDDLGDGYRQVIWGASYVMRSADGAQTKKIECFGCRVLSNPISHESGPDGLGGDITFSFMYHTINGKRPHKVS